MADNNIRNINEVIQPVREIAEKLQEKQNILSNDERSLAQTLESLQHTMHGLQKTVNVTLAVAGETKGVSPERIQKWFETQTEVSTTSHTKRQRELEMDKKEKDKNGFLSLKNIPILVIAILLLFSVVTQVIMVTKISALEQNQAAVNQVLMKGEMNDSSSDSGQ